MMKRLFSPKTVIIALLFGALYSLVIACIGKMAVDFWGRPRGVAYGILEYYYWLGLSIFGFTMVFIFRAMPSKPALLTSLTIITVPTFLLLPDSGEGPFLSVYSAAIMICIAYGAWNHYRIKRCEQAD